MVFPKKKKYVVGVNGSFWTQNYIVSFSYVIVLQLGSIVTLFLFRLTRTKNFLFGLNEMLCAILYHLDNFKNLKSAHGGVELLVKSQVFFTVFKLYKWY